jgi:hypothetical protein
MKSVFITFLIFIAMSATAFGIEVKPANFSSPSPGGVFSFDFIVTSAPSQPALGVQLTIASVTGTGLDFNSIESKKVTSNSLYWVFNNSVGAEAFPSGSSFVFGDGANDPTSETIQVGDIIARFAFNWNGAAGDHTFNLNRNIANSFVFLDNFNNDSVALPAGQWYASPIISATDSSFTVHLVPEPVSIVLFGLGGLAVFRKLRQ